MSSRPTPEYDANDLQALMDRIGGQASSWEEVLLYLDGLAETDAGLSPGRIAAMVRDIQWLQQQDARYTRDYRKMWQRLTGVAGEHLPPPAHVDPHDVDPFEIQVDFFAELSFPAGKRDLLHTARVNNAPERVMDRIEELGDRQYRNRDELLEEMSDADWYTPQQPERARVSRSRRS